MRRTLKIAFICKNCYAVHNVDLGFNFKDISDERVEPFINNLQFRSYCPDCNKLTSHFMVDRGIANSISLLNKRGYETIYSCEGHVQVVKHSGKIGMHGEYPYVYLYSVPRHYFSKDFLQQLVAIGFNNFTTVRPGSTALKRRIDISDKHDIECLLTSNRICVSYSIPIFNQKYEELKKKHDDPKKIQTAMQRYLNTINKKLYNVIDNYA